MSNFTEIRPAAAWSTHADRRTDGRTGYQPDIFHLNIAILWQIISPATVQYTEFFM